MANQYQHDFADIDTKYCSNVYLYQYDILDVDLNRDYRNSFM